MTRIRSLLVAIPAVLLVLTVAAPASANASLSQATYGKLKVSATTVVVGESVTVTGSGFAQNAEVDVLLTCGAVTAVVDAEIADATTSVTAKVTLPKPCTWTITLKGHSALGGVLALSTKVVATAG